MVYPLDRNIHNRNRIKHLRLTNTKLQSGRDRPATRYGQSIYRSPLTRRPDPTTTIRNDHKRKGRDSPWRGGRSATGAENGVKCFQNLILIRFMLFSLVLTHCNSFDLLTMMFVTLGNLYFRIILIYSEVSDSLYLTYSLELFYDILNIYIEIVSLNIKT